MTAIVVTPEGAQLRRPSGIATANAFNYLSVAGSSPILCASPPPVRQAAPKIIQKISSVPCQVTSNQGTTPPVACQVSSQKSRPVAETSDRARSLSLDLDGSVPPLLLPAAATSSKSACTISSLKSIQSPRAAPQSSNACTISSLKSLQSPKMPLQSPKMAPQSPRLAPQSSRVSPQSPSLVPQSPIFAPQSPKMMPQSPKMMPQSPSSQAWSVVPQRRRSVRRSAPEATAIPSQPEPVRDASTNGEAADLYYDQKGLFFRGFTRDMKQAHSVKAQRRIGKQIDKRNQQRQRQAGGVFVGAEDDYDD